MLVPVLDGIAHSLPDDAADWSGIAHDLPGFTTLRAVVTADPAGLRPADLVDAIRGLSVCCRTSPAFRLP